MTHEEIARALIAAFENADTYDDETLGMVEARTVVPFLAQSQFDALDLNTDGQLSRAELEAALGEGVGCPCNGAASTTQLQKYLGDFFLFGQALMVLMSAWAAQRCADPLE